MGMVSHSGPDETALGLRQRERRREAAHAPQHAAGSEDSEAISRDEPRRPGLLRRAWRTLRDYLPRGNTLDEETFQRRHLILCWILALHVPVLWVLGVWRGYGVAHVTAEMSVPLAAVASARLARNRRLASFFTTFGLVYCSSVLVHLTGGQIEAHFHFFVLIGLIALYQDWVPLLWNVLFTLLSHGLGSALASGLIFNHEYGQNRPWLWAVIHAGAVLAASAGVVVFWKNTEIEQQRNVALVEHLATVEVERKEAMSGLLVNLARRNQSLLNRQLEVITDLELREQEADVLEELFRLDHLATRIRRNAESLLVLSGDDPPRRWGSPVPLGDVVRAAAAEIEDYRRVEVLVSDHIDVTGRAVADLAHLLAELIENATTFSPPSSEVRIRSHLSPGETTRFVVAIEDMGIGMSDEDLRAANTILSDAPPLDLQRATMLGFHVVARLAQRYDIQVRLAATPGGGLTALVSLPRELVSDRPADAPAPSASTGIPGLDRYQRAALAWSGEGRRPTLAGAAGPWARSSSSAAGEPAAAAAAAAAGALPERVPQTIGPAWLTTPMPPWSDPIPAQSTPLSAHATPSAPSVSGIGPPTRLDAPSLPLTAQSTAASAESPSPFAAPTRLDTRSNSATAGSTPLGAQPSRLDARSTTGPTPITAQPSGLDASAIPLTPDSGTPTQSAFAGDPTPSAFGSGTTPLGGSTPPGAQSPPAADSGTAPSAFGAGAAAPSAFGAGAAAPSAFGSGPIPRGGSTPPGAQSPPAADPGAAAASAPGSGSTPPADSARAGAQTPLGSGPAPLSATTPLGAAAPLTDHSTPLGSQPPPLIAGAAPAEPKRVVPRASDAAAQVHPGTRLGPVAAFVELQMSSSPIAPATPGAGPGGPVAPETETETSWWAALVVPAPAPVQRASIWPAAAAGPPPLDVSSTPVPPPAPPAPAAPADDGLARRVPGTHLAAALRRDAPSPRSDAEGGRDADRVRAMLSRFQASQNAGRVAADSPRPRSPEEKW